MQNGLIRTLHFFRRCDKIGKVSGSARNKESTKMEKKEFRKKFLHVITGSVIPILYTGIIRALAIHIFVTPNKFAPGGINGLSVLLEYLTALNSGYFLIIFNVPLFFLAFFLLGKREAIVSTASMLVSSGLLILFPMIGGFPVFAPPVEAGSIAEPLAYGIMAAVASGILLGVPLAGMLRNCGTAGGTGVLASLVNKKYRYLSVSWMTSGFDAVVVVASFFVYYEWGEPFAANFAANLMPVLLALVSLYVTSKTSDVIMHGFQTAYKFEIITTHPEEVAAEIMQRTHHGVTLVHATGMYSHSDKSMLVCLIRKRQIAELQRIIKKYPDTFAYFASTSEVYGKFIK